MTSIAAETEPDTPRRGAPVISVVISTYNRAHMIGRAIQSVLDQTFSDFEMIVVDDSSPDETEGVVRSFQDSRIRYIRHHQNLGGPAARNTGIQAARSSQYLAYLDDDDEWLPQKLERQLEVFQAGGSDLGVVGCGRLIYTKRRVVKVMPRVRGRIWEELLAGRVTGCATSMLMVKRFPSHPDVIFDEAFPALQDREYLLRIAKDYSVDFVWEPLVKAHRDTGGPHVANPSNAAKGYSLLLHKYCNEINAQPGLASFYHVRIANELAATNRIKEARQHLAQAIENNRRSARLYLWLAMSYLGSFGVRLCHRFIRVTPS